MSITREQVADLREGDVVELQFPTGSVVRGPLTSEEHYGPGLGIASAGWTVRDRDGEPGWGTTQESATLTVVSRTPRPLYVNHPRTEPVPGDVVRVEFGTGYEDDWCMNAYAPMDGKKPWLSIAREDAGARYEADMVVPKPGSKGQMRLLVDGETGQVVP